MPCRDESGSDRIDPGLLLAAACSYRASTPEGLARQERAVDRGLAEGVDADGFMRLVERHRIQGVAWDTLARLDRLDFLGPWRSRLQESAHGIRVRSLQLAMAEQKLLRAFAKEGVECLTLKGGPGLSRKLYGDLGLRQCKDLDLIVKPRRLEQAARLLESWGWVPKTPVWMSSRSHRWLCGRLLKDLSFVHPEGDILLELHFRFERGWQPDRESDWWNGFASVDDRSLGQAEFLFLCLHGAEHCWHRLKWLGDLAAHLERTPTAFEDCAPLARRLGLESVLAQVMGLLGCLYSHGAAEPGPGLARDAVESAIHALMRPERADMDPWDAKSAALEEDAYRRRLLGGRSSGNGSPVQRLLELAVRPGDVESMGTWQGWIALAPAARGASWIWRYGTLASGRVRDKLEARSRRWCLAAETGLALLAGSLSRRFLPFARISRFLGAQTESLAGSDIDERTRAQLVWAFELWHRRWILPPTCLTEVIALRILFDRRGISGVACFGVRSGSGSAMQAHAWMESGGHVLPRRQDVAAYRLVSTFRR